MTLLKRITATLRANLEQVVDRIENQDALVEAAIHEMRGATARTKARLGRVRHDREELERQIADLAQAERQWERRARATAPTDEETALGCLARRDQCRDRRSALERELDRHRETEARLEAGVRSAEGRMEEMARQRLRMRGRQSAAEALQIAQAWNESGPIDLDAVFERWEGRLLEAEISGQAGDFDPLERRFRHEERDAELRAELQSLIATQENGHE